MSMRITAPLQATHFIRSGSETLRNFAFDEVQNTLPQNMASWHIDYFKLEDFEKVCAGRTL